MAKKACLNEGKQRGVISKQPIFTDKDKRKLTDDARCFLQGPNKMRKTRMDNGDAIKKEAES